MNIGLLGYGRMGVAVERIATSRGHAVTARITHAGETLPNGVDVWIDFSSKEALAEYLPQIAARRTPVVIGTTNWASEMPTYRDLFATAGTPAIFGSNFSVGVQLFWRALAASQQLFDRFADTYDVAVWEAHHRLKKDAPGGTALTTAQTILDHSSTKKRILTELPQREVAPDELHVGVTRVGSIPGTHAVMWDASFDTVELRHTARTRDGFATGAVLAAEKVSSLPAGLHDFSDVFGELFSV